MEFYEFHDIGHVGFKKQVAITQKYRPQADWAWVPKAPGRPTHGPMMVLGLGHVIYRRWSYAGWGQTTYQL